MIISCQLCGLLYAIFMLEKLKSSSGNLQHIVLLYDTACTLQQHLRVNCYECQLAIYIVSVESRA